jgi:putative ABC transport system substrate-binding protein
MRRRDFITVLGGAAAWPLAALAQRPLPVIAVLGSGAADAASSKLTMQLFEASLRELGLVRGRDYVFETRWADSDASRFRPLAAELLALHPRAIVAQTNLAITTIQSLSRTVPIVGASLNAPLATGLVVSLAHPGGNVTGVSTMADDLVLKQVEIMRQLLPQARKLLVMMNPTNSSNPLMFDLVQRQFASQELSIDAVRVSAPAHLDAAFAELGRQHPDALYVLTDSSLLGLSDTIVARALAQRVPAFGSFNTSFAQSGGLFNYARDPKEAADEVARLLKKILAGASPADLPVEQPTKYTLIINLKTARLLGITVPPSLLALADEVIE